MVVSKWFSLRLHTRPHHSLSSAIFSNPKSNHFFKKSPFPNTTTTTIPTNISVSSNNGSRGNGSIQNRYPISRFLTMGSSKAEFTPQFDGVEPDPTLFSDDLKPTTAEQRTFSGLEMASLWIGLVVGVPACYLAGSLVDLGMAWWQGVATVVAANIILLAPLVLIGDPGTRYGISSPVLARLSFGIRGAIIPTLLRALVGFGWYGIEAWIGGAYNLTAITALVLWILPVIPGFLQDVGVLSSIPESMVVVYNNAWFFSFFSAGILHWILSLLKGKRKDDQPLNPLSSSTS